MRLATQEDIGSLNANPKTDSRDHKNHGPFVDFVRQGSSKTRNFTKRRIYGCDQPFSNLLSNVFPLFGRLANYRWQWVLKDILAGCVVASIHLPLAMAGAMTAVMKPHHGLYMTIFPALIYAFLGSSPHNHVGGMPISAALTGVSTARIREEYHPDNYTMETAPEEILNIHFHIAGSVALLAGITQLAMGFLKLGFISNILSSNVMDPFSVACCLQAICGQIPIMLGIKLFPYTGLYKHPWLVWNMFSELQTVNGVNTLVACLSASAILGFREFAQPRLFKRLKVVVPIEFFVVLAATYASYLLGLKENYGVRTMGTVSTEIPKPKPPPFEYAFHALQEGFINGVVTFALTMNSAKVLARKDGDKVSPDQELVAIGATNIFASFFSCFVSAAPVGRSVINQSMGSKSQLSSIAGCCFMLILLTSVGDCLSYLPVSVVSANIVVTLLMTLKIFADIPSIWRRSKLDALIWVSTFIACIWLDVRLGLMIGVGMSWLSILYRSQKPKIQILGHIPDSAGFLPLRYYENAMEIPGIRLLQFQSALHYGNAEYLVSKAKDLTLNEYTTDPRYPPKIVTADSIRSSIRKKPVRRRISVPSFVKESPLLTSLDSVPEIDEAPEFSDEELRTSYGESHRPYSFIEVPRQRPSHAVTPEELEKILESLDDKVQRVILDLSMAPFVDSVGFRALEQLANDLEKLGMELLLAHTKGSISHHIKRLNLLKTIPEENIFLCIEDAVVAAVQRNLTVTFSSKEHLEEEPDDRFYAAPAFRVQGLPGAS